MNKENCKNRFEQIYKDTYSRTLKYIICKCNNLDDVNDLVQDTYVELYKNIKKDKIKTENIEAYIIGIANNIMKKYYRNKQKDKIIMFACNNESIENNSKLQAPMDLEIEIVTKNNVEKIWKYVKNKNILIAKIFYLYYGLDIKIVDIAKELEISESNVKNNLYRTIKELKNIFGKEVE